jgi:octaprenyl-diphosphate synthase
MSLGEMLELEHKLNFDLGEDVYFRLILEKTAVLLSAACEIGALLAFPEGSERRLMADFGTDLGMAFQITDDILDIEGDVETLGKSTGSDILDGKITLPTIHVLQTAPPKIRERVRKALSAVERDPSAAKEAATLVAEYGGLDYARQRARGYADRALELLDGFEDSPIRATLHDAVEYVLGRRQ